MNEKMKTISNILFGGLGGSLILFGLQLIFPSTVKLRLTINGENMIITQEKYTDLYNTNTELQNELENKITELEQTKEELLTAQSSLSEAEEKVTTLSGDMPKFEYSDFGINIEGTAGNNYAKGFLNIDGRDFILLDSIKDIVGKDVNYEENVLYIGHTTAEKVYLMDVCPPYDVADSNCYSTEPFKMTGTDYKGFSMKLYNGDRYYSLINLDNQFSTLEFDFGHVDGSSQRSCTLNIYLDDNLVQTIEQQPDSDIKHIIIPLNYGRHLKFELLDSYSEATYGFGNLVLQY